MTTRHKRRPLLLLAALCASLPVSLSSPLAVGAADAASTTLTNGCAVSARGIPSCGAYLGGAYGSNSDVTPWENTNGRPLGIHRTYYGPTQVSSAVSMAKADAAKKRVPWISFKLPQTWADMAAGKGDAWAKDLATKMKAVDGPVWLAFHHEPENDKQDIQKWKAMQARLAPIVRAAAPNVSYTIILMGYHEFYGAEKFKMENIWPANTKIDVAGFDVYEKYGMVKNGVTETKWTNFKTGYFLKIKEWSAKSGVPWGLAETGYSDPAAKAKPTWIQQTSKDLHDAGGIAFAYFNTTLNSTAHWALATTPEKSDFAAASKATARLS